MGDDVFEVARDKGVRIGPNTALRISSIEECPRSIQSPGIMGTGRTDKKRDISGELDTLNKPTRNCILRKLYWEQ